MYRFVDNVKREDIQYVINGHLKKGWKFKEFLQDSANFDITIGILFEKLT